MGLTNALLVTVTAPTAVLADALSTLAAVLGPDAAQEGVQSVTVEELKHRMDAGSDFVLVDDRAIGTDQSQKFVYVVDSENKVAYRSVTMTQVFTQLRLEPGGTVSGRILGLAEHELFRVQVTAWRDGLTTLLPLRALAGTDGRYRIAGLPLGEWRITARRSSYFLVERTVRLKQPGEEAVLDQTCPEGVALSGRVLLNDGKPLDGAVQDLYWSLFNCDEFSWNH